MLKDIFLCHTGADKDWVEALAKRLEEETIDNRQIAVWFDKWDINGGENILDKIEEGLKSSRFVGVVLSPAMTRAEWPKLEWQSQVYEDPAGRKARILPILRHHVDPVTGEPIEIPLPLRILKRYDFTNPKRFEAEFRELLRRIRGIANPRGGAPAPAGPAFVGQEEPTGGEESLLTNLLPPLRVPDKLWSDETKETDAGKLIEKLKPRFPFWIGDGQLHSFWAPESQRNPFKTVLTGRLKKVHKTTDWLADPAKSPRIVQMFNRALRTHCFKLRLQAAENDRELFFCSVSGKQVRKFSWGPNGRGRTLAKIVSAADGTSFGVHHAAKLRFVVLGGSPFLLMQPGWYFTKDGSSPLEGAAMGVLSMRWGGRERNAAVLRNVLMWGLLLANRQPSIQLELGADVATVPSANVFFLLRTRQRETTPERALLALGGVPYDRMFGGKQPAGTKRSADTRSFFDATYPSQLPLLPTAQAEVLAAARLLGPSSVVLTGEQATESGLKAQNLSDFEMLHFAVHAFADPKFPERAALVLLNDADVADDGLLQPREIGRFKLNAAAVVLSACDTAVGPTLGQEGVLNIARAFLLAGAHSVVTTLWAVTDATSTALMRRFYENISAGQDIAEALMRSKTAVLEQFGPDARSTVAAFQIVGIEVPRVYRRAVSVS